MSPRGPDDTVPADPEATIKPQTAELSVSGAPGALDAPPEAAPVSEPPQAGRVLADRYCLESLLGKGAHGEVWIAHDRVVNERVALKWLLRASGSILSRIRREITTLRMIRAPGVVRLLDEGIAEGRPFLVMERVPGSRFPGAVPPCPGTPHRFPWSAIADATLSLVEVLSRVHAAGIVHRDLKPDNVLVTDEGRATLLDFGISLWSDPDIDRLTSAGHFVGTPRYGAPEQVLGKAIDARADLYAVGVMLYEALTGRVPHEAPDIWSMLNARRLGVPPPPVRDFAPDVPKVVGEVIDRLLATRVEDRFRTASEVLAALRGEAPAARTGSMLPWLGSRRPVEIVVEAVSAGRSVDVVGPPGSGRSRCLREAAQILEKRGRRLAFTEAARSPLASLQPVVGAPENHASMRLNDIVAWVEGRLRAALAEGVIIFVDAVGELDPWSRDALTHCGAGAGVLVRASSPSPSPPEAADVVMLAPLDEASLRPLFAGPDRLFHLREDAARMLWERTDGVPARIQADVTLWTRLGLARWDEGRLVVERAALGRLKTDALGALPTAGAAPIEPGTEPIFEDLLRWLSLGGHCLELSQLARVMGEPVWKLEAECGALVARGAARWLEGMRVMPCGHVDVTWLPSRRVEAHRAIAAALRPGQEGRLFHLMAAEQTGEAAREAVETARRLAREGDLAAAVTALGDGLRAVREHGGASIPECERLILAEWIKVALADETPHAMDRAHYEITRSQRGDPEVTRLEGLVRAAMAASGASSPQALELADELGPFADPELERWRQWVRVRAAAARASAAMLDAVLDDVAAWAERSGEPLAELSLAEGRAILCYIRGDFEEAAALNAEAAEREPWQTGRISATLKCASGLLEAFRHSEAASRAAAAERLASSCRSPYWEGRAEWLLRAATYRMGQARAADVELVEAVRKVGVADLEGLVSLNEAAVAFRAGDVSTTIDLAERAGECWRRIGRSGVLLARGLSLVCGAPAQEGEVESLVARALQCKLPGVGIQALGLLGRAFPEARGLWLEAAPRLLAGVPREHWSKRMDVLSMDESIEWAGVSLGGIK